MTDSAGFVQGATVSGDGRLVAFLSDPSRIVCTSFEKKYMGSGVYVCGLCGAPMRHAVAWMAETGAEWDEHPHTVHT